MFRKGLTEKLTFDLNLKEGKEKAMWRRGGTILNCMCKDPEAECLAYSSS